MRKPSKNKVAAKAMRRASREAELKSGIRPRAQTFADRKKVQNKRACRSAVRYT